MDATATTLCMDNDLPILVFDLMGEGNVNAILAGRVGRNHGFVCHLNPSMFVSSRPTMGAAPPSGHNHGLVIGTVDSGRASVGAAEMIERSVARER